MAVVYRALFFIDATSYFQMIPIIQASLLHGERLIGIGGC